LDFLLLFLNYRNLFYITPNLQKKKQKLRERDLSYLGGNIVRILCFCFLKTHSLEQFLNSNNNWIEFLLPLS